MEPSKETIPSQGFRAFRAKHQRLFPALIASAVIYEGAVLGGTVWLISQYGPGEDGGYIKIAAFALLVPLFAYSAWILGYLARARAEFWHAFALKHGWSYEAKGDVRKETGLMFSKSNRFLTGFSSRSITNVVGGPADGRNARIFEYMFTTGSGKQSQSHFYTVFEFTFAGTFPHFYLNRKADGYDLDPGNPLRLPMEFEKHYQLFAPNQYEIEALEIFTPDLLAHLIDEKWPFDLELLENRLLIYRKNHVNSEAQLVAEWNQAKALVARLAPRLDRMTLSAIGSHSPRLG